MRIICIEPEKFTDAREWCRENVGAELQRWWMSYARFKDRAVYYFHFEDEIHSIEFALRWSDVYRIDS